MDRSAMIDSLAFVDDDSAAAGDVTSHAQSPPATSARGQDYERVSGLPTTDVDERETGCRGCEGGQSLESDSHPSMTSSSTKPRPSMTSSPASSSTPTTRREPLPHRSLTSPTPPYQPQQSSSANITGSTTLKLRETAGKRCDKSTSNQQTAGGAKRCSRNNGSTSYSTPDVVASLPQQTSAKPIGTGRTASSQNADNSHKNSHKSGSAKSSSKSHATAHKSATSTTQYTYSPSTIAMKNLLTTILAPTATHPRPLRARYDSRSFEEHRATTPVDVAGDEPGLERASRHADGDWRSDSEVLGVSKSRPEMADQHFRNHRRTKRQSDHGSVTTSSCSSSSSSSSPSSSPTTSSSRSSIADTLDVQARERARKPWISSACLSSPPTSGSDSNPPPHGGARLPDDLRTAVEPSYVFEEPAIQTSASHVTPNPAHAYDTTPLDKPVSPCHRRSDPTHLIPDLSARPKSPVHRSSDPTHLSPNPAHCTPSSAYPANPPTSRPSSPLHRLSDSTLVLLADCTLDSSCTESEGRERVSRGRYCSRYPGSDPGTCRQSTEFTGHGSDSSEDAGPRVPGDIADDNGRDSARVERTVSLERDTDLGRLGGEGRGGGGGGGEDDEDDDEDEEEEDYDDDDVPDPGSKRYANRQLRRLKNSIQTRNSMPVGEELKEIISRLG